MNCQKHIKKLTSDEISTGAMGAGGVLVLLFAMKAARGASSNSFSSSSGPPCLGDAVWWHFHQQH